MGASSKSHVLIVDDDVLFCKLLERALEPSGVTHESVHTLADARRVFESKHIDTVLLDLDLPDGNGKTLVEQWQASKVPIIVLTADARVDVVLDSMRLGAYDYLTKPLDKTKLLTTLARAVERSKLEKRLERLEERKHFAGIVGDSEVMRSLFDKIQRVAGADVSVTIQGESGTGKELVARALHDVGHRAGQPFVALNCAAIAESLQESELFGHEKGAFTGALSKRIGLFEEANGGTLFLDEIAELSPALQAKLLRVLQEKKFRRLGGAKDIESDFRVICASHKVLSDEIKQGRFRADLYFRLAVFELSLPALRDRGEDIPILAKHFLTQQNQKDISLSSQALTQLCHYSWPGNVRELQNALRYASVLQNDGVIDVGHLPQRLSQKREHALPAVNTHSVNANHAGSSSGMTLAQIEEQAIRQALIRHEYNVSDTVRELGIGRTTLYRKLKAYKIEIRRVAKSAA